MYVTPWLLSLCKCPVTLWCAAGLDAEPTLSSDPRDLRLWTDIVKGRPELEDDLSLDAKEMKADMYVDTEDLSEYILLI